MFSLEVAGAQAAIDSATNALPPLQAKIATAQKEQAEATKIREVEAADFKSAETELTETIDMLSRAAKIITAQGSRVGGDTQALIQKDFSKLESAVSLVLTSSRISIEEKDTLSAMLQTSKASTAEDDDDDDVALLQGAPKAASYAYESKSDGIVEVLQSMKEKAQETLQSTREAETGAKHNFQMMMQTLKQVVESTTDETEDVKAQLVEAQQTLGTAQGNLQEEEASLAEFKDHQGAVNNQCDNAAKSFTKRSSLRHKQSDGLNQAIDALSKVGHDSFVQTSTKTSDVRDRVASMLQKQADETHDLALAEVAQRVKESAGGFDKIIGLINGLIEKLEAKAAEEMDQKAYCDKELGESEAKLDKLTTSFDKHQGRKDKNAAALVDVGNEAAENTKATEELRADVAQATEQRNAEQAEFDKTAAQAKADIEALDEAIKALQEIFGGDSPAFVQTSMTVTKAPVIVSQFEGSDMTDGVQGPVAIVMTEKESSEEAVLTLTSGNDAALAVYKKFKNESEVELATRTANAASLKQRKADLAHRLEQSNSDLAQLTAELAAVQDYDVKMQAHCTYDSTFF